jgi:hypothetical protein
LPFFFFRYFFPSQNFALGELGLVKLNLSWPDAQKYMQENAYKEIKIGNVTDELNNFIVEPFSPHDSDEEYYVSFQNHREGTLGTVLRIECSMLRKLISILFFF